MKKLFVIMILCLSLAGAKAQTVSCSFNNVSLSEALRTLNEASSRYDVNFIYNELEDFRVSTNVQKQTIPDAVRQVVGFYPMRISVSDSLITVECTHKTERHLKGRLIDESGDPLVYATVAIYTPQDSTLIDGGVTNDSGIFVIPVEHLPVLVRISLIGYKEQWMLCEKEDAGTIRVETESLELQGATVAAERPQFVQSKDGSLITQVEGTVLSQTHEMTDLVAQIPGIVRTANGGYEVFGSGAPVIYINNKKVQDANELKMLSPKEIKSMELITNPGAKYDAEGKAVLRIYTLRKEDGVTLQVGINTKQNEDPSCGSDFRIGYKRNGLNVSATYGYVDSKNRANLPQSKTLFLGKDTHTFIQDQEAHGKFTSHGWKLNADYEIGDKHIIGMEWDASYDRDGERRASLLDYMRNSVHMQSTDISNDYQNDINFNHVNIFHNGRWGERLSSELNLDYASNNNDYRQETDETTEERTIQTQSTGNSRLDILAGKLALNYEISDGTDLSWGFEYNHINGNGYLTATSAEVPSSDYANRENKYALYVEFTAKIGGVGINGGVRYEDLVSGYDDHVDKDGSVHRHYRNFYPSLSLNHKTNGWSNTLSFSSRTSRPTFRQLSNSSYYSNEFMYQRGNPLLKPSNSYIAQWSTGYKFISFSASYTYVDDYIATDIYSPDNGNTQIVSSYANFDKIQYIKANLNLQKNIAWWRPSLSLGVSKPFFEYEFLGEKMSYNKAQYYILANQYFTLPKSYLLSVYYYLNSGGNQGAVELKPYQMLNVGLQKSFFDGKLSISLNARDIFRTMKYRETEQIKNIQFRQTEDYRMWNYSVSLIYRMNAKTTKYRGKTSISSDLERL